MKFSFADRQTGTEIEFRVNDDSTIDEVLEEFQNFLRACGYIIDYNKVLDLVENSYD